MLVPIARHCLFATLAVVALQADAYGASKPTDAIIVKGVFLKAFIVAHDNFVAIADLPAPKKDLENYTVHIRDRRSRIEVVFLPKLPPGWFGTGGETPYGRAVHYEIDKRTYAIVKRTFEE